jgi:hypothetical protein
MHNIVQSFAKEQSLEESIKNYSLEMELLMKELCKKNNNKYKKHCIPVREGSYNAENHPILFI